MSSDSRAKVLYLSGAPRVSTRPTTESLGPRSHILGVINAFESHGFDVGTFIVGDSTPDSMHAAGSEARMSGSRLGLAIADAGRFWYRQKSRTELRKRTSHSNYSMVYERYGLMQELGSIVRSARTPWVLEVNALLALEATTTRKATSSRVLAERFEARTLRSADVIVAVTETLALAISRAYGVPLDRIITIENGVDSSLHNASPGTPAETPTLGFLGALYEWQRVDALLTALAHPENSSWRLRVAGEGAEFSRLQAMAEELGLAGRVEFLGRIHPDDVPSFLQTVDLCYAGHTSAGGVYFSPLKLWEYLAAGRAVLASTHETTRRLASDGFPVVCFGDDADGLREALTYALHSREELLGDARAKQQEVWSLYSWEARLEPLVERLGLWRD